ncbi:MAG TPA: MFS transporter [Caproiciproducens sp.]|nr:MFS transporter [Caproiciproducens sp.]
MKIKQSKSNSSRWIILLITVISTFMSTLDSSIVNVALPVMAVSLHVDTGLIAWVVSSYLIVISVCILLFGRLGDLKGQGKIFRIGLLIFTVGSFLCGVTHSLPLLIAARSVQAVGAAASMANSQGIITRTFPPEERGRALGINGAFVALGTLVGPALGGLIISFASWEYLFWVNVPIGIIAYIANFKFSNEDEKIDEKLDIWGFLLFTLAIAPLFIALEYGQTTGYGNPLILTCFAVAAAALAAFLAVERRVVPPLLDLQIFENKWFSISIFCSFTSFVAISCSNIILPFYLQNALSMSAGTSGLFMTIYPLVLALTAPISGYLSDKIGSEVLTLIGLGLTSGGLFLMSGLNEHPSYWVMGIFIGVMSLGNGLFQSPNNSLVMSMVPQEKLGIGGSVNALVRNIGLVMGIALSTTILYSAMSAKIGVHVTGYVPGRNDAFIFGMRLVYIAAAAVCLVGVIITAVRLRGRKHSKTESA